MVHRYDLLRCNCPACTPHERQTRKKGNAEPAQIVLNFSYPSGCRSAMCGFMSIINLIPSLKQNEGKAKVAACCTWRVPTYSCTPQRTTTNDNSRTNNDGNSTNPPSHKFSSHHPLLLFAVCRHQRVQQQYLHPRDGNQEGQRCYARSVLCCMRTTTSCFGR